MIHDSECRRCPLYAGCRSVCIPMRRLDDGVTGLSDVAILVVGEKPGDEEDRSGRPFVGKIGSYVHGVYIRYVHSKTTVRPHWYGTNAVRCKPPQGTDPTIPQVDRCQAYLVSEIDDLCAKYRKVVVLACGAPACRAVFGCSVTDAVGQQGISVTIGRGPTTAFATFNPAVLLEGRNPALLPSIQEHLLIVADFLTYGTIPDTTPVVTRIDLGDPFIWYPQSGQLVAVDIETYGAVSGYPVQTVFHPVKAAVIDGCRYGDQITRIAASVEARDGTIWVWSWGPREFERAAVFLERCVSHGAWLLGMNLPFDLMFMRAEPTGRFRGILDRRRMRDSGSLLVDLSITSFLYNELRPEKGLKAISPLERAGSYDTSKSLKSGYRYPNLDDPDFIQYNEDDPVRTLVAHNRIVAKTRALYPNTAKFTPYCMKWFSDVLWSVLEMDETGIECNRPYLEGLRCRVEGARDRLLDVAKRRLGLTLGGKGSQASIQDLFERAYVAGHAEDRIKRTKTRKIQTDEDRLNLVLGLVPVNSPERIGLLALRRFKKNDKLLSSYLKPLLDDPRRGLVGTRAYPSWYPVPSRVKGESGSIGGTKQGRLTCKDPAALTWGEVIKRCIVSRFPGGRIVCGDESQIELRIPALMSNDPNLVRVYLEGRDSHTESAIAIFGPDCVNDPDFRSVKRQLGKTLRFLVQFLGGPDKYAETARRDCGIELDHSFCVRSIRAWDRAHPMFRAWQKGLVAEAVRNGRLELELTGESRLFLGGSARARAAYAPEIVNFPVQTRAANVTKSAQRAISDELLDRNMQSTVIFLNVYDAVFVDTVAEETADVVGIVRRWLTCPPYYADLQSFVGRTLPLGCEVKVLE